MYRDTWVRYFGYFNEVQALHTSHIYTQACQAVACNLPVSLIEGLWWSDGVLWCVVLGGGGDASVDPCLCGVAVLCGGLRLHRR